MKTKSNKSLLKRYKLSKPKGNRQPKVKHASPGFSHNMSKRRKFGILKGKMEKSLQNSNQIKKIIKALS